MSSPVYMDHLDEKKDDVRLPLEDWWQNRYEGLEGWKLSYCCPSVLSACLCLVCCPYSSLNCLIVKENQEAVIMTWGSYSGKIQMPGCYYMNPCGIEVKRVDTRQTALVAAPVKVADHNGNPLEISGIVTYYIGTVENSVNNVQDVGSFMETQAQSVVKAVVAKYPYESHDGTPSLKSSHNHVAEEMRRELQEKVKIAGAVVVSFELTDLSYAPEIAQAMLVRQQAEATVSARNTIVKGAVQITNGAVEAIESHGVKFTREEKATLMGNLLITICGETKVQPVMSLEMP